MTIYLTDRGSICSHSLDRNGEIIEAGHISFHHNDLYINPDFRSLTMKHVLGHHIQISPYEIPTENHRYHIFYNLPEYYPENGAWDSIISGSLSTYVGYMATRAKVVIHVPKSQPELKEVIRRAVMGIKNCIIVYSKNSHPFQFFIDDGSNYFSVNEGHRSYLILSWYLDRGMACQFWSPTDKEESKEI